MRENRMTITPEQLDHAETVALKMAEEAAYHATERVAPAVQLKTFNTMRAYLETGIRLMRAAVENEE